MIYSGRFSFRVKIFVGFLLVCTISIFVTTFISYLIIRNSSKSQSETALQKKAEALIASFDYALSNELVREKDIPIVLKNRIYEIADINKHDIIIYNMDGKFILSNKDLPFISQKQIPKYLLDKIRKNSLRTDFSFYNPQLKATVTSSYFVLKNNILEPIGIIYFPFYYNDTVYLNWFNEYLVMLILANIGLIAFSGYLSWVISKNILKSLTKISDKMKVTELNSNLRIIKYKNDDELSVLVKSYNRMIYQIREQKDLLTQAEREKAWREMAKQVAHEVKNPLTPMKLHIQNFQRKFDPNDPDITEKVKKLSISMVDYIDLIAKVATAFSEFAKLPEKEDSVFNLVEEVRGIANVFDSDKMNFSCDMGNILVNMDKIYLTRIMTNLIVNAKQATEYEASPKVNVAITLLYKKVQIIVEDNGIGISKENIFKIFEPNFTTKSSGTGLGLSMVKKMVEEYQGSISVESTLGVGSRFLLIIPTNL